MTLRKSDRLALRPAVSYYTKSSGKQTLGVKKRVAKSTAPKKTAVSRQVNKVVLETPEASTSTIATPVTTLDTAWVGHKERGFDLKKAAAHLIKVDPRMASVITEESLAKFQSRLTRSTPNAFDSLASSIIYQQISGKAAETILRRFVALFNQSSDAGNKPASMTRFVGKQGFPTPEMVLAKSIEELRSAGLSARKAEYIQSLAQKFIEAKLDADKLNMMSDDEISKVLCSVKGIGQWTVDMYMMMELGHPDVLPLTDLGVRKGVAVHFGLKSKLPTPAEMLKLTEPWRPYRTLAAWHMWQILNIKPPSVD